MSDDDAYVALLLVHLHVLEHATDRVEEFLLGRFPETCRIERTLASFSEISG